MTLSIRSALAAAAATAALALAAVPAQAATYVLNLTGDFATLSTNAFTFDGRDYDTGVIELSGFDPFTLEDGDSVDVTVTIANGPFVTPVRPEMFIGLNFSDVSGGAQPEDSTATGFMNLDGGPDVGAGCGNCTSLIAFQSNGPFAFNTLAARGSFTLAGGAYDINSISLSYQVSGPTAVPEPASWALMIAGFGAAGALLRRRRTAPA